MSAFDINLWGILWSLLALLPILWLDAVWDMVGVYRTLPSHRRKGFWVHYAWRPVALSYLYAWDKVYNYCDFLEYEYYANKAGTWLRSDTGRRLAGQRD